MMNMLGGILPMLLQGGEGGQGGLQMLARMLGMGGQPGLNPQQAGLAQAMPGYGQQLARVNEAAPEGMSAGMPPSGGAPMQRPDLASIQAMMSQGQQRQPMQAPPMQMPQGGVNVAGLLRSSPRPMMRSPLFRGLGGGGGYG